MNTNGNVLALGASGLSLAATSNASATIGGTGGVLVDGDQAWADNNARRGLVVSTPIKAGAGAATLTLNGSGVGGVTLGGVLADGVGPLGTVFDQAGTTTLTAANTYTGSTTVNSGLVEVTSAARLASTTVVVNGGTLRVSAISDGIADTADVTVNSAGTLDLRNATAGVDKAETIGTLAGGGTLTLAGPNAYSGGTTLADRGGDLLVTHSSGLGTGNVTIEQGGSDPTATLHLAGNSGVTGVTTINIGSRDLITDDGIPTIENVSGDNAITANLNINMTGGIGANVVSIAGTFTLTGNLSSTGLSSTRGFDFAGGDGIASGTISNGTAQPTFVQKDGQGPWMLSGNNT